MAQNEKSPTTGLQSGKDHEQYTENFDISKVEKFFDTDYQPFDPEKCVDVTETMEDVINGFPVEVFPEPLKSLIDNLTHSLNFVPDFFGTALITAIATAIGKSAMIAVKKGWYLYPTFYTAIVGDAGVGKTHPTKTAFKPILDIDREKIKEYKYLLESFENELAARKKDNPLPPPEKPRLEKIILHNFTNEILHTRMQDNDRGLAVVSDELDTFFNSMNNYSKGDNTSAYLSFWTSESVSIDRVNKDVPLFIEEPFLNIIGGLQPRILPRLFPPNKVDNGFLHRFLFAFPDTAEKQPINDNEPDTDLIEWYGDYLKSYINSTPIIYDRETGQARPKTYYWSVEAKEFFYKWQAENTRKTNENAGTVLGEIINKFDYHFPRIALVLQIMEGKQTNQVGIDAAKGAEKLCAYYVNCSKKLLGCLQENKTDSLPDNKLKFYLALPNEFSTGEAVTIGINHNLNEKFVKRFLSDKDYFKKLEHGKYAKK